MTTQQETQQDANTTVEAFHFLGDDRRLRYEPYTLVETGLRLEVEPPLEMCRHGLHGSVRALDALRYAPGALVCRTRHSGVVLQPADEDKLCSSVRDVIAGPVDATRVRHQFAVWVATQALNAERLAGREPDPRCWGALEVKLLWLDGKATDSELAAARDAAWDAAWDAARAAARDAARDAAWDATRDAAWDAAWDKFNTELETRLLALLYPVVAAS